MRTRRTPFVLRSEAGRRRWFVLGVLVWAACATPGARGGDAASPDWNPPSVEEHARAIEGLVPPKRARPVIAVVGDHGGTETTDFLIPYAVLHESGLVDVLAVAPENRAIPLMPALTVEPQGTLADFDRAYPDGADYVVVPAYHDPHAPAVVPWIQDQARRGATIIGICSGAKTLGRAGLLDGRRATTHWFDRAALARRHTTMELVKDRRFVVDRGIATTTGVTASVPFSLALVEAIGGTEAARALAQRLRVEDWHATHRSDDFQLRVWHLGAVLRNWIFGWPRERVGLPIEEGVDEIALAFTADAYARTGRSRILVTAQAQAPVLSRRGLRILPDAETTTASLDRRLPSLDPDVSTRALDEALDALRRRYGERTAAFVALQLEYAGPAATAAPTPGNPRNQDRAGSGD